MTIGFESELKDGETNFYIKNIGNSVNLLGDSFTLSGDLHKFDRGRDMIIVINWIDRRYNPDGSSKYWENPIKFEVSTTKFWGKHKTTREDRRGRIEKYNNDLEIEELEKKVKLRELQGKYSKL